MIRVSGAIFLAVLIFVAVPGSGKPSPAALPAYAPHPPILIMGDANFTPANGVVSGTGTPGDPYVIEGWEIDTVTANAVDVRGTRASFVVRNIGAIQSDSTAPSHAATYFDNVSGAETEYVTASEGVGGFFVRNSEGVGFAHVNASAPGSHGVVAEGSINVSITSSWFRGEAIRAVGVSNLTISANHVVGPGGYVYAVVSSPVLIHSNVVEDGLIRINGTRDAVVSDNVLDRGWILAMYLWTDTTTISGNVIRGATEGIAATETSNLTIRGNSVLSTMGAVRIDDSSNITVVDNHISDNAKGVTLRWSRDVSFLHNDFAGNGRQVQFESNERIRWNESYPTGGNFWSDYTGIDNCSGPNQDVCPDPDGIGDTPYSVAANNSDRYPFIHSFANDTTAPSVSISSPAEGAIFQSAPISVSGNASDSGGSGLQRVEVRVNNRPWTDASGRTSWQAMVELDRGASAVEARAWDRSGNPSAIGRVNVTYEPPAPPPNAPPYVNFTWSPFPADTETVVNFTAIVFDDHDPVSAIQVRWDWESDGTWDTAWSLEKVAQHRFSVAGSYNVTLEAKDTDGLTASRTFTVPISEPPPPPPPPLSVHIVTSPSAGTMPLTVSFTSDVSGGVPPYEYQWTLGDGSTSPAANTVHIYLTGGNFTVWLIASDAAHQSEVSNALWVNVTPAAVNLTVEQPTDFVQTSDGTNVSFHASVWGGVPPYAYRWDFGDDGTSTELQPTHTYSVTGNYTVRFRVTDSEGRVAGYVMVLSVPATRSPAATTPPPSSVGLAWVAIGTIGGVGAGLALGVLLARRFRIPKGRREN